MSFLQARSPVTPKITMPQGPAIRGSRRSLGSRSGLVPSPTSGLLERRAQRAEQAVPGRLELVDALVLEDPYDVVEVDAHLRQLFERALRGTIAGPHRVTDDLAVVDDRIERLLGHGVDGVGGHELGDVACV